MNKGGARAPSDPGWIRPSKMLLEPSHEIMVLFVLHKFILQTRMRSNPVGQDV